MNIDVKLGGVKGQQRAASVYLLDRYFVSTHIFCHVLSTCLDLKILSFHLTFRDVASSFGCFSYNFLNQVRLCFIPQ